MERPIHEGCDRRRFIKSALKVCAGAGALAMLGGLQEAAAGSAPKPVINAHKCTGCGKCVRVAARTFALNRATKKAYVKNPTGDSAPVIFKAAAVCRTKAITLK